MEDRPVRALASSIASRRPELAPGIILLYVVSLTSRDGAAVHVEPLVLHLAHDVPSSRQTSAHALRQLVIRFTNPAHLPIRTHVEAAIRRALDAAAPVHQRVAQALWQRRLARKRARASTARQLVQAGLFDRRAAAAAATAATVLAPDPEAASSSMSTFVLGVDVRLSAVLRVTAR